MGEPATGPWGVSVCLILCSGSMIRSIARHQLKGAPMKKLFSLTVAVVFAFVVVAAAKQGASAVSGKWELTFQHQPGLIWILELKAEGSQITGTMKGRGEVRTVKGAFENGTLTFSSWDAQGDLDTSYTGSIKDGALTGTGDALEAGRVHRFSWTAARPKGDSAK
jgi:hypothetical protein